MRFSGWPSSTAPFEETLPLAQHLAATGWDGVWIADHFMPNTPTAHGSTNESFTTLAALAAAVPRVRLGTIVAGNTYRHPAVVAKMAASIDRISGGRFVLGMGGAWQENEHAKYGIYFPPLAERLRRLDEACQVLTGLFTNDRTTFAGKYYQLDDAPLDPKPVQKPLPILIGGGGEKKTMRTAAKYAQEWNIWGTPELLAHKGAILDEHCRAVGRDPKSVAHSAVALLVLSDDPEVVAKAAGTGRPVIAGNVAEVKAIIAAYIKAGVDEIMIPDFNMGTPENKKATYDRFMNEVVPEFR